MDPELWELLEEGDRGDQVAAIIRLGQPGNVPAGVRVVAQFGEIATVRMARESILKIRGDAEVASFKAPGPPMGPEVELDDLFLQEGLDGSVQPSDVRRPPALDATGREVCIGVVDWGMDFAHADFRNADGSTRLLALWDQRGDPRPESPQPYGYGIVHTREAINRALESSDPYAALGYHPGDADLGSGAHGTLVASIAAGNGDGGGPVGIAPEAELVFVHNATWGQDPSAKLGNSVTLLEAIDFITRTAGERPCAINLSMGRTGEQHDGTTLVEQGLDAVLRASPGRVICQSTGNYFSSRLHASGQLRPAQQRTFVWQVSKADVTPNEFEIWYPGRDKMQVEIRSPDGSFSLRLSLGERAPLTVNGQIVGRAYHRAIEPNNLDNHIDIFLYAGAPAGAWEVTLIAADVVDGRFHAWIERDAARPGYQSHFRPEDADPTSTTGTICNGVRTIAVGAYNPHHPDEPVAPFSSMGPTRDSRLKPDLCAPGVGILGARSAPRTGEPHASPLTRMSGTSFAAPHVTGCVALMLQVAPRPLRIEEVHNLLLANTRQVDYPHELPGRVGSGYLDIQRAVEAARQVGSVGPELAATSRSQEAVVMHENQEIESVEFGEGRTEEETNGAEAATWQNTYHRIASDITGAFEGGQPGTLNLYDRGVISYGKHQATLASGTLYPILKRYTELSSSDVARKMSVYLQRVKQRDETLREDKDFIQLLKVAAREPEMNRAQDEEFARQYWEPSARAAKEVGIQSALGYALLYDTRIQGGQQQVLKRTLERLGGTIGDTLMGKAITEQEFLRVFVDERVQRNLRISANQKKQAEELNQEADALEEQAARAADPELARELRQQAADKRKKAKQNAANAAALDISSNKTRGPSWKALVASGDLNLYGDAHGKIHLKGKASVEIAGLEPGATIDAAPSDEQAEQDTGAQILTIQSSPVPEDQAEEGWEQDVQIAEPMLPVPIPFASQDVSEMYRGERTPARLVELAEQVIADRNVPRAPSAFLSEVLLRAEVADGLALPGSRHLPSAAEIFDAYVYPGRQALRNQLEQYLEVVALPRSHITRELEPGDLIVQRGEGGLGHVAMLATGETWRPEELTTRGIMPASTRPGYYSQVIEAGSSPHGQSDQFARRLSDDNGQLSQDTLILRVRDRGESAPSPTPASHPPAATQVTPLPTRLEGIDIYEDNTGFPSFSEMARAGYSFVFHKASQYFADRKFQARWTQIAQAGMLRGAYHLLTHNAGSISVQAQRFAEAVGRLVPGDLGPALDLEDRDPGQHADYWVPRIQEFADLVESRLGRQPIFYTSRSYWQEFAGDDLGFGQYPLWVVWVNPGEPRLPAGWTKWYYWQWHYEKSASPMPAPFRASDRGVDLNHFNGTIYQLRGMADLGHTAPHRVGNLDAIAYTERDGRVHLLEYLGGSWRDQDLFSAPMAHVIGTLPLAAGDPAAIGLGNEQLIAYRSADGGIHALTRTLTASDPNWRAVDITGGGGKAVDDPFILAMDNNVHVIYGDEFNAQVHVMRLNGVWQAESLVDRAGPHTPSRISGSAATYAYQNVLHIVSRSGTGGHLLDWAGAAGSVSPVDLTAGSRAAGGAPPPAATYRPASYAPAGKAPRIVFRAIRGDIWQIERDTLVAKNLSLDAGHAPPAAGSPTAVVKDLAHVLYRTLDGTIIDMFDDAGVWRRRDVCREAAADPTAFVDSSGHVAVSFRANDGTIRVAYFVNGAWLCEIATRSHDGGSRESAARGSEAQGTRLAAAESAVPAPSTPKGLPLLLAGPIVRRATPERVWFWFACSKEPKGYQPSITPYDERGHIWTHLVDPAFKEIVLRVEEDYVARLGENIWVVLCSAVPKTGKFPTDIILGYDLNIATDENGSIRWTKVTELGLDITYPPFPRPTFVIGELNRRLAHGSCRRPGAPGEDASRVCDEWLAKTASDAFNRPNSLILTGDQIYADDVAVPLFEAVHKLAQDVFGYIDQIPKPSGPGLVSADSYTWKNVTSQVWSGRRYLTHRITSPIGFTTEDGEAHLLSFPEYAAMYLTVWNPELCQRYGVDDGSDKNLKGFERGVRALRRVMANTATYMLCDDHEITDDWNLDQQWEDTTKGNAMARRIIANGLAAYWAFQAWGNEPSAFERGWVDPVKMHLEQMRTSHGTPGSLAQKYDEVLLERHWSFMAASNPKALCVDTRTRRETPKGKTAILSGRRVWPFIEKLLKNAGFHRGETLLLVLPTPFLPHRSMMYIQKKEFKWPEQRYEGDYELYGNNPQQRAELIWWLQRNFGPSALVIFSGDVHHGSVVTGRYGYGPSLDKIKAGKADWAVRVVQITSSPIKNVKTEAYEKKRWWTLWQTDAGNVGESLIPQWETQYASTTEKTYIAMQAFTRKLDGELGRRTYVFENHYCVVDMPARPGGYANVLFVGVRDGHLATASISVDTDNDPSKFQIENIMGRELPKGILFPGFEMSENYASERSLAASERWTVR